jgi:hypothetical protein
MEVTFLQNLESTFSSFKNLRTKNLDVDNVKLYKCSNDFFFCILSNRGLPISSACLFLGDCETPAEAEFRTCVEGVIMTLNYNPSPSSLNQIVLNW